jgi:hypothetical protein
MYTVELIDIVKRISETHQKPNHLLYSSLYQDFCLDIYLSSIERIKMDKNIHQMIFA